MDSLKIIVKRPEMFSRVEEVVNSIEALQMVVGGFFDQIEVGTDEKDDKVVALVNQKDLKAEGEAVRLTARAIRGTTILVKMNKQGKFINMEMKEARAIMGMFYDNQYGINEEVRSENWC